MTTDPEGSGLYVHVPFCSAKCVHCGFFSLPSIRLIPDWLEGLEREADLYPDWDRVFDTLYLGGGSPSLLSGAQLRRLLGIVRRRFRFAGRTETTLEMNPEDVSPEKIGALLELGVNRINLGVQALEDRHLHFLGRRHSVQDSLRGIEALRAAGCANLGLDLIYGLPGQPLESWLTTLDQALESGPEHLSCYQLTVESGTPLERMVDRGEIVPPSEEESRRFFLATSARLTRAGYIHYEVSNFARSREFISRHNSNYWLRRSYLGLGPSAHSFGPAREPGQADRRWWNHRSLKAYLRDLEAGRPPLAGEERLSPEDLFLESVCLGLRTELGLDLDLVRSSPETRELLERITAQGLGVIKKGRLIPTPEGMVVADSLALALSELGPAPARGAAGC